jgi:serine/threonine-protein kinase
MIGKTLGRYHILEKLGEGGMGVVYRARDRNLGRDVAIKILPEGTLADSEARRRFRKEAEALSKLSHPNIETIHDFDTENGGDYMVVEFIPGVTLDERVAAGPLPEKEILRLGEQLAEGLVAAHAQQILHRDMKCGNVRLTTDGRLKILDFGLAKLLESPDQQSGSDHGATETVMTQGLIGTVPYMPPEQLQGEPCDARSDLYSAGVVLYEMATGRRPFEENLAATLTDAILHRTPVVPRALNARLSPELERIIVKLLEKDPDVRYQSAQELLVDLRRLRTPTVAVPIAPPRSARGRWRVAVAGAVVLLLVVLAVWFVGRRLAKLPGSSATPRIDSLAVLPLADLSGDPGQEYFADGMTEALIADLAKIKALKVISRTSIMRYKRTDKSLPRIAEELGVDAVVEGSVLRSGDRVRITAQLVEAATDRSMWTMTYERDLRDILALQREVARAIAGEIQIALTPEESARLAGGRLVDPAAHEAYLKGRYFWNQRTPEQLQRALDDFQRSIEIDPEYGLAYSGLADTYILLGNFGVVEAESAYREAKAAATRALELDDTLAEAHTSLAGVLQDHEWNWSAAEREYQLALKLNANYATARHWYATLLHMIGRFEEAVEQIETARRLDPFSLRINSDVGLTNYYARRYDRAASAYRRTLELDPDFTPAHAGLGQVYEQQGLFDQAVAELEKAKALKVGGLENGSLGHAYARAGRLKQARQVLAELNRRARSESISPFEVALIHIGLGENEEALNWLETAYEERDFWIEHIKIDPRLDPLRPHPRFQELLRRMKFPE